MVETMGLEPTTPCLQSRCSSQLSYVPVRDASCYGCASHGNFPTLTGVLRDLVDPLWLPLVVLGGAWVYVWRRGGVVRWIRIVTAAAIGLLWLVATPLAAMLLERPLVVESTLDASWQPEYIYVLAGGFDIGDSPEEDSSGLETVRRVNRAVMVWREHPTATLVMAGNQPGSESLREPDQQGRLMQEQAERLGVPSERIMIDPVSSNTNGHAKVARDAAFLTPDTPLAIVTSDFHLRRSRREFSRFFNNLRMIGADPVITDASFDDISLRSLWPTVDSLQDSTTYLREYVALVLSDIRN